MLERRRLGRQIVIYTRTNGIYLRSDMGFEFWSKLDPGGQHIAITFPNVREAKRVVRSWETQPSGIQYKQVRANITMMNGSMYANIEACFQAGLPGWDPYSPDILSIINKDKYITPRHRKRLKEK
ncbi:hypothetical protein LCGC14_1289020 [marine sediment metagenome]|uniref:Uncharacterized protein n=1 Tax=marine sediment metagenome TaxID=412755 RepID=A0A0F9KT21_9ZZZZ